MKTERDRGRDLAWSHLYQRPSSMHAHAHQSAISHPVCPVKHRGVFESVSHASLAFLRCAVHIFVLNNELLLPPLIYLCIISRVPSISSENVSIQ